MTKDEALDLALEVLIQLRTPLRVNTSLDAYDVGRAITAIKQARSAPVQRPVAWVNHGENRITRATEWDGYGALYTTPPAQPAPVQEPVGTYGEIFNAMWLLLRSGTQRDQQIYEEMKDKPLYTTPPAAKRQFVGLTDEEKQEWVEAMPDEPKPRHIMNLINVIEVELKEKNT